jgi:hypothetical protein
MITPQPLWTPGDDWLPTRGAPEWVKDIEWIHLDNTAAGQVAPGVRDTRWMGGDIPYRGELDWGGARFHVTEHSTARGLPGLPANQQGIVSRIAMLVKGVPGGGTGLLIGRSQISSAIDLLIGLLAESADAEHGVRVWSLVAAGVGAEPRCGLWFNGSLPVDSGGGAGTSTQTELLRRVAETVEVECGFSFHEERTSDGSLETCRIWGPDGRFVTELRGRVLLHRSDELDLLREVSKERQRAARRRSR